MKSCFYKEILNEFIGPFYSLIQISKASKDAKMLNNQNSLVKIISIRD